MLHITETIIVEGKYDKEKLKKITDAPIICTGGFDLYRNKQTIKAIKLLAEKTGIIILTDSDSAGFRIRNYIKQCIGDKVTVKNAYIPTVKGKEKRKDTPGKEGILGVEGMSDNIIEEALRKVAIISNETIPQKREVTKTDFYNDGLTGGTESAEKRRKLAQLFGLPKRISAKELLSIINKVYNYDIYCEKIKEVIKY